MGFAICCTWRLRTSRLLISSRNTVLVAWLLVDRVLAHSTLVDLVDVCDDAAGFRVRHTFVHLLVDLALILRPRISIELVASFTATHRMCQVLVRVQQSSRRIT